MPLLPPCHQGMMSDRICFIWVNQTTNILTAPLNFEVNQLCETDVT